MITQKEVDRFSEFVERYIATLAALPAEEARRISMENLIQTGVLDENGLVKDNIVTEDFFGW